MYKIINWYTQRFSFPRRGWKFFRSLLKATGLYNKTFIRKLHNGAFIYTIPAEHIQQQLFWYGYYEKEAVLTWEALLNKNSTCLDIGANTGYYSLIAAPRAKKIVAFEPSAVNREWLEKNIALNQFTNIKTEAVALSDQKGRLSFYHASTNNTGMSGLRAPENFEGHTEMVDIISVDEWIIGTSIEKIHAIKIDVEGAEMNVLNGMSRTIDQFKPVIFIEVMSELLAKYSYTPTDVFDLLSQKGYKAYTTPQPRVLSPVDAPIDSYTIVFVHHQYLLPGAINVLN